MTDTMRTPLLHRLRYTPMRDLLRGRVSGRLDVAGRIAAAKLPAPAAELVQRVVRRTRLWRLEKVGVADELIAHFLDGLEAGRAVEELVSFFGDERQAAKLIRRAKIRNRPLAWHVLRWIRRGIAVLVVCYVVLAVHFFVGRPSPSTDYIAELNRPIVSVPEQDRAWPMYRKVILDTDLLRDDFKPDQSRIQLGKLIQAAPRSKYWPATVIWLGQHADSIERLREATAKRSLGFIYGPNGSQQDAALHWSWDASIAGRDFPLLQILLPSLNYARSFAYVLMADCRWAQTQGDTARAIRDLDALISMADQFRNPFLINQLVAAGIDSLTFDAMDELVSASPAVLDGPSLTHLAHLVAGIGQISPVISYDGERLFFYDAIQRSYTDDGHGDGRITPAGVQFLAVARGTVASHQMVDGGREMAFVTSAGTVVVSRREVLAEYDRLMDMAVAQLAKPARNADWSAYDNGVKEILNSPILSAKYLPLSVLMPALSRSQWTRERLLGRRDGVLVGIALEAYRRQTGRYPKTLADLTPVFLPEVPADRITGEPVKYKLVNGRPLVYSVGVDRIDDGGVLGTSAHGGIAPNDAAQWSVSPEKAVKGDWLLYPIPPLVEDENE